MPIKNIRFDYYQVCCKQLNEREELVFPLYDLTPILEEAQQIDVSDRMYQYRGEEARLQKVDKLRIQVGRRQKDIWELQFLRIRKNVLPGIASDDGSFDPLDLDDDEGIGEEVSVLYDRQHSIIFIQRNRNSLSPTGIEEYFNEVMEGQGIIFKPIILPDDYLRLTDSDYFRTITISFADIRMTEENENSSMSQIVQAVEQFQGVNAEIKITLGPKGKKGQSLSREEILKSISQFRDRSDVTKFKVSRKEHEDARVEVCDLIEQRLIDFSAFTYSREEPIVHDRVFEKMLELYLGRLRELDRFLRE